MLRIRIIGLVLVAALAMSVVATSSASAAHLWLINGKLIASAVKIHSLGLVLLTDENPLGNASLKTAIHCKTFGTRTVGPQGLGLVEKITAELLGTNDKITCTFDKAGACESSPAPLFLAVSLPWHTELYLVGTEVRYMIASEVAGKNAGWKVICKAPLLGMITDECTAPLSSTTLINVGGGVEAIFDAKTETADCKIGGEEIRNSAGLVRGRVLFESPSAGEPLTFL
jgi:hypothetical protein